MGKIIASLLIGVIVSAIYTLNDYYSYIATCLGCGTAPDGVTDLGPNLSEWGIMFAAIAVGSAILAYALIYATQSARARIGNAK